MTKPPNHVRALALLADLRDEIGLMEQSGIDGPVTGEMIYGRSFDAVENYIIFHRDYSNHRLTMERLHDH